MIKHTVLFKVKNLADKAERLETIKRELEQLCELIPELKEIQVGINMNPEEQWDLALEVLVENMHDLERYANHPAHQQIVKSRIAPIKVDRACADYPLD